MRWDRKRMRSRGAPSAGQGRCRRGGAGRRAGRRSGACRDPLAYPGLGVVRDREREGPRRQARAWARRNRQRCCAMPSRWRCSAGKTSSRRSARRYATVFKGLPTGRCVRHADRQHRQDRSGQASMPAIDATPRRARRMTRRPASRRRPTGHLQAEAEKQQKTARFEHCARPRPLMAWPQHKARTGSRLHARAGRDQNDQPGCSQPPSDIAGNPHQGPGQRI